jgi:TP901 family phage tail tape measure protein
VAVNTEALDIILRLQGVPTYVAGMQEASGANDDFAASSRRAAGMSDESAAASERQAGAAALVSKAMKASGLLLAAAGVEGIRMAIKFERQMELIHTQAGASQKEVENLKKEVLALAGAVPQGPEELAMGLYHLESVGLRGAKAMEALRIAAQGAAVGNTDLESTASALGAAWIVNIKGAGGFRSTMGVLNATVGAGNMRMGELISALGTGILPVAKLAGLSIQDVGAALATLSDSGYSASSGAAQLGTALHFLYAPTTKAQKALETIGLTSKQLVEQMSGPKGLHGALELLKTHLSGAGDHAEQMERLGEIFPGGRGKVILTLITELERLEMKRNQINRTGNAFGEAVKRTMEQPAVRIQKAWSKFQAILIELGQAMEGPATAALVTFASALGGVLGVLMAVTDHGKLLVPIILALGGAFLLYKGALIATAIAQWAWNGAMAAMDVAAMVGGIDDLAAAWVLLSAAMDANPVGLLAVAFALLVAAVAAATYFIVTHFKQVLGFFKGWGGVLLPLILGPFLGGALLVVLHWKTVKSFFSGLLKWIEVAWGKLGKILAYPFEWVWGKISWVFHQIEKGIADIMNAPSHVWHGLTSAAGGIFGDIGKTLGIPGMAAGGTMSQSGFALINEGAAGETVWLPGGSTVQPSPASSLLSPRAHTPNPAPQNEGMQVFLEAYLQMPPGTGRGLFKLITKEVAIKKART